MVPDFEGRYISENGKQSIYLVCVRLSFIHPHTHTLIIQMAKNGFGFEVRKESIHEKPITNQTSKQKNGKKEEPNQIL